MKLPWPPSPPWPPPRPWPWPQPRLTSQRTPEATWSLPWSLLSTWAVEAQEVAPVAGDHLKEEAARPVLPQFYSNAEYEKN